MSVDSLPIWLTRLVVAPVARPLCFAGTGGASGATQLLLLASLIHASWNAIAANLVAFLLAAQLNFAISQTVTWRDRRDGTSLRKRWLLFHASISVMAVVNMVIFAALRTHVQALVASAAGIAVAAAGNYLAGDRLVFYARPPLIRDERTTAGMPTKSR